MECSECHDRIDEMSSKGREDLGFANLLENRRGHGFCRLQGPAPER